MADLAGRDGAHLLRGFMRLSDRNRVEPVVLTSGKGVWVFDERGTPYLEAVAGMWCAAFGFGEEELIEAATRQLRLLPYYHTLTNKSVGPAIELADKIASLVPVADAKVHLTVSGSEANDFTVKFLRYYNNAVGRPAKKKIIARINGYHGATIAATSLTGLARYHQNFDLPLPGFLHTGDPHYYRNGLAGETPEEFAARMGADLEQLILTEGPETVAGFIAEPCTGGGGVVIPPPTYYDEIQRVLDRYDVAFVDDEVVTGFGRTGNLFGAETFGIRPDTMTLGKGLSGSYQPIAAVVLSGEIYEGMEAGSDSVGTFAHGTTYSGHPVAAAVALRALELMEERDIVGHVRMVGHRFEERLRALAEHPLIGDVRCRGLMGAVEFVSDKSTRAGFSPVGSVSAAVGAAAQRNGLIVRTCSVGDVIAFSPPLIITEAEIDEVFDRFDRALAEVTPEVAAGRIGST